MKYFLSSLNNIDSKIIDFTLFQTKDMYDTCMAHFYDDEILSEASATEIADVRLYFLDNALFNAVKTSSQISFGLAVLTDPGHTVYVCLDKAFDEFEKNEFFSNALKRDFRPLGDLSDIELVAVYCAKWLTDGLKYLFDKTV